MSEEKIFRTSNQSRKKKRKRRSGALWLLILIPLIIMLGVALGLTVRYILDLHEGKKQETVSSGETLPDSRISPSDGSSGEMTAGTDESTAETVTPPVSTAESTEEAVIPSEQASPGSTTPTKSAAELLPLPDGLVRDGDALSKGGWYGGKFTRDLTTGVVTCSWDREPEVLALLEKYEAVYHKNKDQKVCYLTFDCGGTSSAANVNEILDILKEKNVKASFFIPGDFFLKNLNRDGETIDQECAAAMRRIVAEGHLIGSHTYTHPQMPKLSDEDFIFQLNTQQARIDAALGYSYPLSYYRPPEGATSERDLYLAQKMGYHVTLWSYAYKDWDPAEQLQVNEALNKAEVGLHDGCVYLLHALSPTNRAMLGDLIDFMKAQGYDIRRVDE